MARLAAVLCLVQGVWGSARGATPEKTQAPDGCPTITHVPLVSVVRGIPAVITATIDCPTGDVGQVTLFVRVTDAGKPTSMAMAGGNGGLYRATVPVSMIEGITRFWYYIDAHGKSDPGQEADGVAQTRWHPVNVIEHGEGNDGAGGGGSGGAWLLGGAGAAVATYLIVDNNNGGGGGGGGGTTGGAGTPPPAGTGSGGSDDGDDGDDGEDNDSPTCKFTGDESASVAPSSACDLSDVQIRICNVCPNAVIEAIGSWGVSDLALGYNGQGCGSQDAPALTLPQPPEAPYDISEEQFSIAILVNGQVIKVVAWPDTGYFDCF